MHTVLKRLSINCCRKWTSVKICGKMQTAFEQSACLVYLPLFVLVTFSKPHNIFNIIKEFVEVCILGIPLRISTLAHLAKYSAQIKS